MFEHALHRKIATHVIGDIIKVWLEGEKHKARSWKTLRWCCLRGKI